ncbi:MAG: hypothetical protein JST12_19030 [Armatimonadetes bacterium]|nr:hypothetical protein [Armatimonadota bacterium]
MISTLVAGLSLAQDAVQFKFQPKIGTEYRYRLTMEDENGKPQILDSMKLWGVFKATEVKDGWYTMQYNLVTKTPQGEEKSEPQDIYKVNSSLETQFVKSFTAKDKGSEMGERSEAFVNGRFGVRFSPEAVKLDQEWKDMLDVPAFGKEYLASVFPGSRVTFQGTGDRSNTLMKVEAKQGTIHSLNHLDLHIVGDANGTKMEVSLKEMCDQTSVIDREIGVPVRIDRKFELTMTAGPRSQKLSGTLHMVRQ